MSDVLPKAYAKDAGSEKEYSVLTAHTLDWSNVGKH